MSQTSKIVLAVAVGAIVLAGAYYYWHQTQETVSTTGTNEEVTTLPSGTNTSDTSLDTDISAVDSQIQSVGTDNASVSQSVSAAAAQ